MHKSFIALAIGALAFGFGAGSANAGAKAVAADSTLSFCTTSASSGGFPTTATVKLFNLTCKTSDPANPDVPLDGTAWAEIMVVPIHISSSESILVTPSLVSGLFTETMNKGGGSSTSSATGEVLLRVVMDPGANGIVAEPAIDCSKTVFGCVNPVSTGGTKPTFGIAFDERIQTLTTTLGVGESIDLTLATAQGHSFQFIFPATEVTQGNHTLAVEVAVVATTTSDSLSTAISAAAFGIGDVAAEVVNFAQGTNALEF